MDLFSSAVYVWNYVHRTVDTWFLGHTWSLSVEEQFYLLWPFVLKLAKAERAKGIALAVVIFAPFFRLASYFWLPSTRPLIGMMLPTRADSLMIGSLLALLAQDAAHCAILKRKAKSTLIPLAALCFFAIDAVLSRRFKGMYILPVGYTLQNLMIAAVVAHVVFHDTTRLGRVLNHRTFVHVGTISYSLYLWQQLFLTSMNTTFMGIFPLNILCAFIAAELSCHIVEKPFLRMRKRFATSHSGVSAAAVSAKANAMQIAASASA
jgi:peptidoglycan/LPS O-acetylase OafA/YrhL